jgi:hypothetical protein
VSIGAGREGLHDGKLTLIPLLSDSLAQKRRRLIDRTIFAWLKTQYGEPIDHER